MDIIGTIFNVIFNLVFLLVDIILTPIDLMIATFIPELANGLTNVANFLTIATQGIGWAISVSGIHFSSIALIATYYIMKLTLPVNVWVIKLGLKWYRAIKG